MIIPAASTTFLVSAASQLLQLLDIIGHGCQSLCLQDILLMLADIRNTQHVAEAEKAATDNELLRIQNLVRSFQDRINAVSPSAMPPCTAYNSTAYLNLQDLRVGSS